MRFRPLGKTNLKVSEIGLGTWGMGGSSWWGNATDESSLRTIARCLEKSINFIDTAYAYGDGHAEELIGRTLQKSGQTVTVATKVPPKNGEWPSAGKAEDAFPEDWIITCTERSLRKLKTNTIDLQQLHVWRDEWLNADEWKKGVERLKRDGKIRFFGVSIDDHNPDSAVKIVESGLVDSVQVIYNIFDQTPEDSLFPACQKHNVGVIVRVPFDEGSLTGTLRPGMDFGNDSFRKNYFSDDILKETCRRVDVLKFLIQDEIKTMPQAALKFCLSHPAVSVVIPGMRKPERVDENLTASDGILLKDTELQKLKDHQWLGRFR